MSKPLTEQQKQVMDRVAQGFTNKEIGDALGLTPFTVRNHVSKVFVKLGARNRVEATLKWLKVGAIEGVSDT